MIDQHSCQEGGSVNNDSVNYNFKSWGDNQSIEGQFTSTWTDNNISKLYKVLMFDDNISEQHCDFIMSGKGSFCLCEGNAANGCIQNVSFGKACVNVRCDFISILEYVNTNECWLVYLQGNGTFKNGFYSLFVNNVDGSISLHTHRDPFPGYLAVIFSCMLCIAFDNHINVEKITNQEKAQARVVFDNFKKDNLYINCVNMTYDQYMDQVIVSIISHQEKLIDDMKSQALLSEQATLMCNLQSDFGDASVDAVVPSMFESLDYSGTSRYHEVTDPMFPDKTKGFINHIASEFTFIGPDREPVEITTVEQCIRIAEVITSTGVPNYRGARIPLVSGLNIGAWETYLRDYPDPLLIEYLKFGFPMSILKNNVLNTTTVVNHHSATQFTQEVDEYFRKELDQRAILGPVSEVRSDMFHCSPLLTRPKDVVKRRVIVNLSHPDGGSVNEFVDKFKFDHRPFTLKLISIDDIVKEILDLHDPMLFKIDVARAFRNLRVDPVDVMKLGMSWGGQYYLSSAVVFGWKHGTASFQLVADAIAYIMAQEGCKVLAYVDDFLVVAERHMALAFYNRLSNLFTELGLPMNLDKRTPPAKSLTCLGISINIEANTLSIDNAKLVAIYEECIHVIGKKYLTKKSFQSLLGKLIYIHKCVAPARIFINRMLAVFRENANKKRIRLTEEFFQDLTWFLEFLPTFNGITYLVKTEVLGENYVYLDASLTGLGAIWNNRVYSTPTFSIPGFQLKIVHLEMLNIVLALRTWGSYWQHHKIKIFCDNLAVVQVVKSSKTKDKFLAACIRNIWLISASNDIEIVIEHIEGKKNVLADLLSRLHSPAGVSNTLLTLLNQKYTWEKVNISKFDLNLTL